MTQTLHIFRKDLRHQRIDLALYLGLLVFVGCLMPNGWTGHSSNQIEPFLMALVKAALPITWLVLITRLVHAEALVGDRQFWTTRPYRWSSLLSAKLLFLAVCIALPYLAMQCAVAVFGGVSPLNAGLLVDAGIHALIVWIPMLLLAAVTATLGATFFTTLATVIAWIAALTFFVGSQGPVADAPFSRPLLAAIFAAIFLALLILLYSQRRILQARLLLGGSAVVFLLLIYFVSKMSPASLGTVLLNARYQGNPSQYRLVYDPSTRHTGKGEGYGGLRYASLPIQLLGVPSGHRLHDAAVQFRVDRVGYHYTSPWRPASLGMDGLRLMVPNTVLSHADAHITIQLAADEIAPGEVRTDSVRERFAIPGGGACAVIRWPDDGPSAPTGMVCRYGFAVPEPVDIQAHMSAGCPVALPPPVHVTAYQAGTEMDPLRHWPVYGLPTVMAAAKGCAVQSLTTTVYRTVSRFRTSVDIPSIRLADDLDQ